MFSGYNSSIFSIRFAGVVVKVCCLMFYPSLSIAQALPALYLSDENPASSEMDGYTDSFLDNLEYYKDHPEEALGDLKAWTEEQNQKEKEKSEENLARKNEQVKVFFGGWMSFFTIVIVLYLLKFAFNIFRDSLRFVVKEMIEMKRFLPQLKMACGYVMKKYLLPQETRIEGEEEELENIELQDSPSKTSKLE
jgi:ribosomal protein L9